MSGPWIRMIFCFSSKKAKWSTSVSAPLGVTLVQLRQSPEPDCLAPAASVSVDEFRVTLARLPCWKSSSDRDAQLLWREQNTCRALPLGLRQQRLVGCQSAGPHWTWIICSIISQYIGSFLFEVTSLYLLFPSVSFGFLTVVVFFSAVSFYPKFLFLLWNSVEVVLFFFLYIYTYIIKGIWGVP